MPLTRIGRSITCLRGTREPTWLAGLALLLFTACQGQSPTAPAGKPAALDVPRADLLPRVPHIDPNVWLYSHVTNLAYGTSVSIKANADSVAASYDGIWTLLSDVGAGTLYDVSIPLQPRGQDCNITPLHGAVGPHTPYVLVNCQMSVVTANDVNATVELGQVNDHSTAAQNPPDATTLLTPWGKVWAAIDGTMFASDRGNHRVVGYFPAPASGAGSILVLGQDDAFNTNAPGAGTQGYTDPGAVGGGNGIFLVADTNNNRVLVYTPVPYGQVDPSLALGQTNLGATASGCGPSAMSLPNQAATAGNLLLVADTNNHRVLIWNSRPSATGAAPDVVLGQPDFVSCLPNQGTGVAFASALSSPQDVWADPNHIVVADFGNHRVLIWTTLPVLSGQGADLAVGQADLNSGNPGTTSATSLNGPMSVVFDNNTLFVADAVDHRVVAYNPFPTVSGAAGAYALGQQLATDNNCNQGATAANFTLCYPTGVSYVGGDLAVTDSNNNRLLIFYTNPNAVAQGSFSVVVSPGSSFFAPILLSYDAKAGSAATATVTALTYAGQTNTGYLGQIGFKSTDPNAVLPSPYTFNLADAGTHDFNVTFFKADTHTLSVYDTASPAAQGADPGVIVVAGDANFIIVNDFPTNPNAGSSGVVTITAYDRWNNVATGFTGTVHIASSDPNAIIPPDYQFQPTDAGTHEETVTLTTPGNQNIKVTVVGGGITVQAGLQPNIIVTSSAATLLDVNQFTSPTTAGVSHAFTVQALASPGKPATKYQGTVRFSSSDPNALLPGLYTFTLADAGVHTFNATLFTSGNQNITVTDNSTASVNGNQTPIVVVAGSPNHLTLGTYTSPSVAGAGGTVTVGVYDMFNNLVPTYTGAVTFKSSDPNAVLPAPYTFTGGDAGHHSFNPNLLTTGNQNIVVTDPNGLKAVNANIIITPAPARYYTLTGYPSPITAGTQGNVKLQVYDNFNNLLTNYTGTVHVATTDTGAVRPADYTFSGGNTVILPVTFHTNGNQAIQANDTGTPSIAGMQNYIVVQPGNTNHFLVSGYTSPSVAGAGGSVSVAAYDMFNNLVPAYAGTVTFTSTDHNAVLPAPYTFTGPGGDAGTHVGFNPNLVTTGNQNIVVTDANGATGMDANILITSAAADHYILSGVPSPIAAGTQANVTVQVKDIYNNLLTHYTGQLHMRSTDHNAVLPADYTFSGGNTVVLPVSFASNGNQTLQANDTATPGIAGMQNFILVTSGNANHFTVTGYPSPSVAGAGAAVVVTAYDMFNNVIPAYTGTITFTSADPNAVLPAPYTFTGASGDAGAHTFNPNLLTAGNQNIVVTDGNGIKGLATPLVIKPNNANYFALTGYPNPATAGVGGTLTVGVYDIYNNLVPAYTGSITFHSADPNAVLPNPYTFTGSGGDAGTHAFNPNLVTTGNQNFTVIDGNSAFGAQRNILVNSAPADHYLLTNYPSPIVAGTQGNVTVRVYDVYNNLATNYTGQLHIATTEPGAVRPPDYTFPGGNTTLLPVTFHVNGNQAIQGNDVGTPTISGMQNFIVVTAANANHFAVSGYPSPAAAGAGGNVTVGVYDMFNNIVPGYTGTISFASADPNAKLPAAYSFTGSGGDKGTHVFTNSNLLTAGNQNIVATDTNGLIGLEPNIVIQPTSADHYLITNYPSPITAGTQGNITLRVYDPYGNAVTNYTGTVHVTSSDAGAVRPGDYTFSGGNTVILPVTLHTNGNQYIRGNDTITATIAGQQFPIVVTAGNANHFAVSGYPSPRAAGAGGNLTIVVQDMFNNTVTGYNGAVTLHSADPNAYLPGPYTYTNTDAGVHVFNPNLLTAGNQNVSVTDGNGIKGVEPNILITSGNANYYTVTGFPSPTNTGLAGNLTITVYDAYNNLLNNYTGTVHVSSSDLTSTLPANYTFSGGNTVTLQATFNAPGTFSLSANDVNTPSIYGLESNIVVRSSNANAIYFSTQPSTPVTSLIAFPQQPVITLVDSANNIVTFGADSNALITLTLTTGTGTLAGTQTTSMNANAGVADFTGTGLNLDVAGSGRILTATKATNSASGVLNANSAAITVVHGLAASVVFTTQPGGGQRGSTWSTQPVVRIVDGGNNLVSDGPDSNTTITLVAARGGGNLTGTATVTASGGIATFAGLGFDTGGAGKVLKATKASTVGAGGSAAVSTYSAPFAINVGAASQLVFITQPGGGPAGSVWAAQPVVQIQDATGLPVSGGLDSNATIALSLSTGPGTLAGYSPTVATGGNATFSGLFINTKSNNDVLTASVTFSGGGTAAVNSNAFAITAAGGNHLVFVTQPGGGVSQTAWTTQPNVLIMDQFNNTVVDGNDATAIVSLTLTTGTGTLNGNSSMSAYGGVANFAGAGMNIDLVGSNKVLTASASLSAGAMTVTSNSFTITAGAASQIAFTTQPSGGTAHAVWATQPVVTLQDAAGNPVTSGADAADTITLSVTQGGYTLAGGSASAAMASGVASFAGLRLDTAGTLLTLNASKPDMSGGGGITARTAVSGNFNIVAGSANQILFVTQPGGGIAGQVWAQQPVVRIVDANNNTVTTGADATRTVTMTMTGGSGTVYGTTSQPAVAGVATFTDLNSTLAATNNVISASATITSGAVVTPSNTFTVTFGPATMLNFATVPAGAVAGVAFTTQPVVAVTDNWYNTVTSGLDNNATIALTLTSGTGALSGTASATASGGLATYSGLNLNQAGTNKRLSATATLSTGIASMQSPNFAVTYSGSTFTRDFNFATSTNYTFSPTTLDFGSNLIALHQYPHADTNSTNFGAGYGLGVVWDAAIGAMRLGNSGGCNGMTTNCTVLDSNWTPRWGNLVGYWQFEGSGSIADGATITATVGSNLTAKNANGSGMAYATGHLSQGINLDGTDDYILVPQAQVNLEVMTISMWVNINSSSGQWGRLWDFGGYAGSSFWFGWQCANTTCFQLGMDVNGFKQDITASNLYPLQNQWSHWAATIDGSQMVAYRNGTPVISLPVTNAPNDCSGTSNYFGKSNYNDPYLTAVIDEVAIWNTVLTPNDMVNIYEHQRSRYGGIYTSRAMDAAVSAQPWQGITWKTNQPVGKGLTGTAEGTTSYPSVDTTLTTGLVGLWHMDETRRFTQDFNGDFRDDSGHDNPFVELQGATTALLLGQPGVMGYAPYVGAVDLPLAPNYGFNGVSSFTLQVWHKSTSPTNSGIILGMCNSNTTYNGTCDNYIQWTNNGQGYLQGGVNGSNSTTTSYGWGDGQWHLLTLTQSNANGTHLYIDGTVYASNSSARANTGFLGYLLLGNSGCCDYAKGFYDEVAAWTVELTQAQVQAMYRRGTTHLGVQVRTCSTQSCIDNPNFQGPNGVVVSEFSEFYNMSGVAISNLNPNMSFGNFPTMNVPNNRYFEYQMHMGVDDVYYYCTYGGSSSPCSPELVTVVVNPNHYDNTSPTISNSNLYSRYHNLTSFSQTLGGAGCPAGITYNISPDGTNWYYYNGSAWAASTGVTQSNSSSTVNTNIGTFAASVTDGNTFFRAYLTSDGTTPCSLNHVVMGGNP